MTAPEGIYVTSWAETELDGQRAGPLDRMQVGSVWSWRGEAVRIDAAMGQAELSPDAGSSGEIRRRAAQSLRKLLSAANLTPPPSMDEGEPLFDSGFQLTDGQNLWHVTCIEAGPARAPLCLFAEGMPPQGEDLWVVNHTLDRRPALADHPPAMVCFCSGTLIATETGPMPVEQIAPGVRVQTVDNGFQTVVWTGARRMTGARFLTRPELAPVRLMGLSEASGPLLVSPDHQVLLRGAAARVLFNAEEVLASARDLVNGRTVRVDRTQRAVTYHHFLLERHEIVFANGVEVESFHPGAGALSELEPVQRDTLYAQMPELRDTPMAYGPHARRRLAKSEVALLRHRAA